MNNLYLLLTTLIAFCAAENKCYWSGCGCPPFNAAWCSEASYSSGWCSESASNCQACSGVFSQTCPGAESTTTTTTTTSAATTTTSGATTTTTSAQFDVPALPDMVNFFEGSHGRDATYYHGHSGGCLMWDSDLSQKYTTVAVGKDDFFQGLSCGTCVKVTSMTQRNGGDILETPFIAVVGDLCQGCQQGDLDFAITGKTGRHDLTWEPIPCPVDNEPLQFRLTESHTWYNKIQVRHSRRPVQSVQLVGKDGQWVPLRNAGELGGLGWFDTTIENLDEKLQRPFEYPLSLRVCDIYGNCVMDRIEEFKLDVDQMGLHQFSEL